MQSAPSPNDLSEPLLGVLSRYVSPPTAQSIVKLARQRANVTTARIDRARLGDMLGPIERNLRLFIDEPSRVSECCAAIHALVEGSAAVPPPAQSATSTPAPSSVRFSSGGSGGGSSPSPLGGPTSMRFPAPAPSSGGSSSPSPQGGPTSMRFPTPAPSSGGSSPSPLGGPPTMRFPATVPQSRSSSSGGAPPTMRHPATVPQSRSSSSGGAPSSVRLPPVTMPSVSEVADSDPISVRSPGSVRAPPSARFALIPIRIEDDISRARSESRDLASKLGFSVVGRTRLVTAVSELARNIVLYAGEGQIELKLLTSPQGLSVVARDHGPGIPNLEQIMAGDYKSRLGMGLGLRGVKRIADRFEIQTAPGQGTTVSFSLKVM